VENPAGKPVERELPSLFVERFFQFLALLLLFISLLWGQNHLIYLSVLLLTMINGAKLWCKLGARNASAVVEIDRQKAFPGEKILLGCRLQNSSWLPIWLQIEIPLARGFFNSGVSLLRGGGGLIWREKIAWEWELVAPGRGYHKVGPLNLISGDLLGFFQQKREAVPSLWLTVYPRIVNLRPLSVSMKEFFGDRKGKSPIEDPAYPVATRDYRLGSPARHIHWKATLRHNRLQEKVFEHTLRKKVFLAIDVEQFQKQADEEGFEAVLEVVASLVLQLHAQGCSTGLVSNGLSFLPGPVVLSLSRGEEHLQSLLQALALLRLETGKSMAGMFRGLPDFLRGSVGLCFAHHRGLEVEEFAEILQINKISAAFILNSSPGGHLEKTGHSIYNLEEIRGGAADV
jgi:uncharacterized protein (DUF58 family)